MTIVEADLDAIVDADGAYWAIYVDDSPDMVVRARNHERESGTCELL